MPDAASSRLGPHPLGAMVAGWTFNDSLFERTASSFDNPDFVDVVIHCYRFCFGSTAGDPALASLEARLAEKPKISVPAITLDGPQARRHGEPFHDVQGSP